MDKNWTNRSRRLLLHTFILLVAMWWSPAIVEAEEDFSYNYGDPSTPLNDGYIVSTSNAVIFNEGSVRFWKPNVGSSTLASTTPAEIIFHFPLDEKSTSIDLWMNMPTFHWSYSRGHNFLFGSIDGTNWEELAEVTTPAFGTANDLGTVPIPESLLGAEDLWLRVNLYSFGSSAANGGVLTNTAQLSRHVIGSTNTSFSLNISTVPEPSTMGILALLGGMLGIKRRRR